MDSTTDKVTHTMCGSCSHFEPNGTQYGGACTNKDSDWHEGVLSKFMDGWPCHSNNGVLTEEDLVDPLSPC